MTAGRPTVLVIFDDGDVLDLLTRLFEASGFEVLIAVTGFRAQQYLEGEARVDVVVAPWSPENSVGGDVYRWALQQRYDLRDQFVFMGTDLPVDFDRFVAGRCIAVPLARPAELVRCAIATLRRHQRLEAVRDAAFIEDSSGPSLLLCDDDPTLLDAMGDLFGDAGYRVTRVHGGQAAIRELATQNFDAIVADWHMDDGNGAELYRWLVVEKPDYVDRIVFLSSEEGDDTLNVAPGRPMFRKGQDSTGLTTVLREIVRQSRGELSDPTIRIR